jgi:hypothetical protein
VLVLQFRYLTTWGEAEFAPNWNHVGDVGSATVKASLIARFSPSGKK